VDFLFHDLSKNRNIYIDIFFLKNYMVKKGYVEKGSREDITPYPSVAGFKMGFMGAPKHFWKQAGNIEYDFSEDPSNAKYLAERNKYMGKGSPRIDKALYVVGGMIGATPSLVMTAIPATLRMIVQGIPRSGEGLDSKVTTVFLSLSFLLSLFFLSGSITGNAVFGLENNVSYSIGGVLLFLVVVFLASIFVKKKNSK
jgi:hypothetical protein